MSPALSEIGDSEEVKMFTSYMYFGSGAAKREQG
jgi:hypothetical protein